MLIKNLLWSLLLSFSITGLCSAQEISLPIEYSLPQIQEGYCSYPEVTFRFKTFSPDDIPKARSRYDLIKSIAPQNEWEGLYYTDTGIGDNLLVWGAETGFHKSYCYHYVDRLDFGRVEVDGDVVRFVTEKPIKSEMKNPKTDRFEEETIRVLFGEKHFLVPTNKFRDFALMMAGRYVGTGYIDLGFFWTKQEDMRKPVFGIPIVPEKFRPLLLSPIEARIKRIGPRKLIPNDQSTQTHNADEVHYIIELDAGTQKGIAIGMDFFVDEMNEWIRISKVSKNTSTAFFRRSFDERNQEYCLDSEGGSGESTPCKQIKVGLKTRTKTSL